MKKLGLIYVLMAFFLVACNNTTPETQEAVSQEEADSYVETVTDDIENSAQTLEDSLEKVEQELDELLEEL